MASDYIRGYFFIPGNIAIKQFQNQTKIGLNFLWSQSHYYLMIQR